MGKNHSLATVTEKEISEFTQNNNFPEELSRRLFIQHLIPYVFVSPLCSRKHVLEVGIGDGFGMYFLSKYAKKIVGLDFNFAANYGLKRYLQKYNVSNTRFINGNAVNLPFKTDSFDIIITCQLIEHIPEEYLDSFVLELKRVLKKSGKCLVATLNISHNLKNKNKYVKFSEHHKEFNKTELQQLLSRHFSRVTVMGLKKTPGHLFIERLKRWGFSRYGKKENNFIEKFYNSILPRHYTITPSATSKSVDLYGLCEK